MSWFYEFTVSLLFRAEVAPLAEEIKYVNTSALFLTKLKTVDEKESLLRYSYPTIYIYFLHSMDRKDELADLLTDQPTPETYTWHIHSELLTHL